MSLYRIPIGGWKKCTHQAAAFDSRGEYAVACVLDRSATITWWLRNEPPFLRIPTPIGHHEPDFVYSTGSKDHERIGILEVKGDPFWNGPESNAQIKARAACQWVRVVNEIVSTSKWEYLLVLDQDASKAGSFEELIKTALLTCGFEKP